MNFTFRPKPMELTWSNVFYLLITLAIGLVFGAMLW